MRVGRNTKITIAATATACVWTPLGVAAITTGHIYEFISLAAAVATAVIWSAVLRDRSIGNLERSVVGVIYPAGYRHGMLHAIEDTELGHTPPPQPARPTHLRLAEKSPREKTWNSA